MAYYTRILTPTATIIPVEKLRAILKADAIEASLRIGKGQNDNWTSLVLSHKSGIEIAAIERNPIAAELLGQKEIDEFLKEIANCKPASAAKWLSEYLPKVQTIYAFQWLNGSDVENGRAIIGSLMIGLHKAVGGVIQADGEGFSDDEGGDHILWQFSDGVKGPWQMAVLREGKWMRFQMQLGDQKHREAFLRGEIPAGAKLLE